MNVRVHEMATKVLLDKVTILKMKNSMTCYIGLFMSGTTENTMTN